MKPEDIPPDQRWSLPQQVYLDLTRLTFGRLWRLRVEGREHLPAAGGCLLVANHPSYWDSLALSLAAPRRVRFLGHPSHWHYPAAAYLLDLFETIPIDPHDHPRRSLEVGLASLAAGRLLAIYPEGDLSRGDRVLRFSPGAARLALSSGCPVVPAALLGTRQAWPYRSLFPRLRPVTVRFGPPVNLAPARGRRPSARLLRIVTAELRRAVLALYEPTDPRERRHSKT